MADPGIGIVLNIFPVAITLAVEIRRLCGVVKRNKDRCKAVHDAAVSAEHVADLACRWQHRRRCRDQRMEDAINALVEALTRAKQAVETLTAEDPGMLKRVYSWTKRLVTADDISATLTDLAQRIRDACDRVMGVISLETGITVQTMEQLLHRQQEQLQQQQEQLMQLHAGNAYNKGLFLQRQRKYAEAEEHWRLAIGLNPTNAIYVTSLANNLFKQGKYTEAEGCYSLAFDLDPRNALYATCLANNLFHQRKYREAEKYYHKAESLDSNNATHAVNLGNLLFYEGRFAEAEICYRRALMLEPMNADYVSYLRHAQEKQSYTLSSFLLHTPDSGILCLQ